MTSFTISSDGINVQRLKGLNRRPGVAAAIAPISATRGLHKTSGAPKAPLMLNVQQRIEQRRFIKRRRRLDRRHQERRKHTIKVLLDTRTEHERRVVIQRINNRTGRVKSYPFGIDVIV